MTLLDVLGRLIRNGVKESERLRGGLVLAYTPTDRGDCTDHRLVWSRHDSTPSTIEDDIVHKYFKLALQKETAKEGEEIESGRDMQQGRWGYSFLVLRTLNGEQLVLVLDNDEEEAIIE